VIVRILRALLVGDMKKTKLAWAGKISYDVLQIYLELLLLNDLVSLVQAKPGHELVRITDKGRALLRIYDEIFSRLLDDE